jgi:phosphatidylethanolamine-binding protein (PEBP) family uncharacterized protein
MVKKQKTKKKGGSNIFNVKNVNKKNNPMITLLKKPLSLLIMYDPDAPDGTYLHYLLTNIPNGIITNGNTIIEYMPPSPPSGTHRYIFEQYIQISNIDIVVNQRDNFDLKKFIENNNLKKIGQKIFRVSA